MYATRALLTTSLSLICLFFKAAVINRCPKYWPGIPFPFPSGNSLKRSLRRTGSKSVNSSAMCWALLNLLRALLDLKDIFFLGSRGALLRQMCYWGALSVIMPLYDLFGVRDSCLTLGSNLLELFTSSVKNEVKNRSVSHYYQFNIPI